MSNISYVKHHVSQCFEKDMHHDLLVSWSQHNQTDKRGKKADHQQDTRKHYTRDQMDNYMMQQKCTTWNDKEARATRRMFIYEIRTR